MKTGDRVIVTDGPRRGERGTVVPMLHRIDALYWVRLDSGPTFGWPPSELRHLDAVELIADLAADPG